MVLRLTHSGGRHHERNRHITHVYYRRVPTTKIEDSAQVSSDRKEEPSPLLSHRMAMRIVALTMLAILSAISLRGRRGFVRSFHLRQLPAARNTAFSTALNAKGK